MAQTSKGALKVAAHRVGLSVEEFQKHLDSGSKRCIDCKLWKPKWDFNRDKSRHDGLAARCRKCNQTRYKLSYTPVPFA